MKNVIVLADFPPLIGGPTIWYYRICEILLGRGYRVFSLGGRGEPPQGVVNLNPGRSPMPLSRILNFLKDLACEAWTARATLFDLGRSGAVNVSDASFICSSLVLIRRTIRLIPSENGIVLCAHANRNSLLGYLLCKRHGSLKLIIRCHGACVLEFAARRPVLVRFLLSRAHAVNCVSRYIADIAVERGAHPQRTSVILSARDVAANPDFGAKKNRVLFCANLKSHKDPLTFVRAAEICATEYPGMRAVAFYLIGDGPLRQQIATYIDTHNLRSTVTVCGSLPFQRVWQLMAESKILALTSTREPSGAVLTEAMALGCYCIATRVGGVPEIVTADRGSLFEAGDCHMLAQLIADYFRNEETYRVRVEHAYRFVKDVYSFERAANLLEDSFDE